MKFSILIYALLLHFGQLPVEAEPELCLINVENLEINIEGIFTSERKWEVTQAVSEVISNTTCWQQDHEVNIVVDGSNKIKILGLNNSDSRLEEDIRAVLSEYDWDYLHEVMTVNILIRYRSDS